MDGLIIAAGIGSRLRSLAVAKPLAQVANMTLLEIAVKQLATLGIKRIVVVTGYRADLIEAALPKIAVMTGLELCPVRTADFNRPNGYSVMSGADQISGNFILVMADHILSSGLLTQLASAKIAPGEVVLAIDRRLNNPLVDPEDATYVRLKNGTRITAIGKSLAQPDAIDCGAFMATPALSEAIAQSIADGKAGGLSDGMQYLADRGRAGAIDIGENWWLDVDDPRAMAIAQQEYRLHLAHLTGA